MNDLVQISDCKKSERFEPKWLLPNDRNPNHLKFERLDFGCQLYLEKIRENIVHYFVFTYFEKNYKILQNMTKYATANFFTTLEDGLSKKVFLTTFNWKCINNGLETIDIYNPVNIRKPDAQNTDF